ncbi:hypothetical protein HOK51_07100 [Candidatus Woesearchaeota archaeon]|jgi:hypothetical protein|nr:hypothetical protein [Candidatus Woesearchaeota archaeon]MBT6519588.1 hypothetical protein [Candidatus Woesearchaeota archaeon]MBT7367667.1 hypothetical protein [Candidatus Woesearchaeota archaeon]
MGRLADNIDKILELESQGKTIDEISESIGLGIKTISAYKAIRTSKKALKKLELIRTEILRGNKTAEEISKQTKISHSYINIIANANRIILKRKKHAKNAINKKNKKTKTDLLKKIEQLADSGKTFDEILAETNKSSLEINYCYTWYGQKSQITYKQLRYQTDKNEVIRTLNNEKNIRISSFVHNSGISLKQLGKIVEDEIEIDGEKIKIKEFLYDDFVLEGKTLIEIQKHIGYGSRERARQYVNTTGQYDKWVESKEKKKKIKKDLNNKKEQNELNTKKALIEILTEKAMKDCNNKWAKETALRVYLKKNKIINQVPLEKLIKLYEAYEFAKKHNISSSLKLLRKYCDINSESQVSHHLSLAGLKLLSNYKQNKEITRISSKQKERILTILETVFSSKDISYFINLPQYVIEQQLVLEKKSKNINIIRKKNRKIRNKHRIQYFSYKKASEIYKAIDNKIKHEDIKEILEIDNTSYKKYLKQRANISQIIIQGLKNIYPELTNKINKPYLTYEIKEIQKSETRKYVMIKKINDVIDQGADSVSKIKQMIGHTNETIKKYAELGNIDLPQYTRKKQKQKNPN